MKILLILAMMGWGLVWPLSKIMTSLIQPEQASALRFIFVALSFIPIMLYLKISFVIPKALIIPVVLTGVFNGIYTYLMYVGLQYGDAGSAGVIAEVLSPIMATFIWAFLRKRRFANREKWGLFFGIIAGIFLIDLFANFSALLSPFNIIYLLAALTWALLMISSRYATEGFSAIALNFYSSIVTISLLFPSFFIFDTSALFEVDWEFWVCVAITALFCTTFSTTVYYKALYVLGVMEGGIYALLVPIFALGFSWILLEEIPQWHTIIGGILAIFAIYLINYFDSQRKKRTLAHKD